MSLTPQGARRLGIALGAAIFILPMAVMVYSGLTWEPSRGTDPESARRVRPLPQGTTEVKPAEPARQMGPLALELMLISPETARVTFRNTGEGRLRLVLPAGTGGALAILAEGRGFASPRAAAYDPERDGIIDLLPGDSLSREYRVEPGLIRPRAIYDTRGQPLPEGAWSGRAESPPIR